MVSKKLNIDALKTAVKEGRVIWRKHVLERLIQRGIKQAQILDVVIHGECISEYLDDKPFQSGLFLGFSEGKPIHVVASVNEAGNNAYIITAYTPTLDIFKDDYRTRRT